jgi:hypothetical protein
MDEWRRGRVGSKGSPDGRMSPGRLRYGGEDPDSALEPCQAGRGVAPQRRDGVLYVSEVFLESLAFRSMQNSQEKGRGEEQLDQYVIASCVCGGHDSG